MLSVSIIDMRLNVRCIGPMMIFRQLVLGLALSSVLMMSAGMTFAGAHILSQSQSTHQHQQMHHHDMGHMMDHCPGAAVAHGLPTASHGCDDHQNTLHCAAMMCCFHDAGASARLNLAGTLLAAPAWDSGRVLGPLLTMKPQDRPPQHL